MELAARQAQIGIAAAAVVATIVVSGVYVVEALGATGAATLANSAQPLVRVALEDPRIRVGLEEVEKGVRVFVEATDLAGEEEAEREIVAGAKRMFMGR